MKKKFTSEYIRENEGCYEGTKNMYIVEFENGINPWWLAPWNGDPGRTVVKSNAKKFKTEQSAKVAMNKAIKKYTFKNLEGRGKVILA